MPVGANARFTKYFTFPDYDTEAEKLGLEWWLYHLMQDVNPVKYMWENGLWT